MTLIFSWLTHEYVLQMGDRLLSSRNRSTGVFDPRDAVANKGVIFRAKNALVAIGYSGHAYLEGIPTDQWIVEKITGDKTMEFEPGQPASMVGRTALWLDAGNALLTLERELNRVYPRGSPEIHEVTVTGWQWRRDTRLARPIIGRITNLLDAGAADRFTSGWIERGWHLERHPSDPNVRRVLLDAIGWPTSPGETDELKRRLGSAWHAPMECQQLLVDAMRAVAAGPNSPPVGGDCMSIFIPHPRYQRIETNFLSLQRHRAMISGGGTGGTEVEIAFTPWIIGPNKIRPPAMINGSHSEPLGPVMLFMQGPPSVGPRYISGRFEQVRPNAFGVLPARAPRDDSPGPPLPPPS